MIIINNINITFYSLVRGKGLVQHVIYFQIFNNFIDNIIWKVSLITILLVKSKSFISDKIYFKSLIFFSAIVLIVELIYSNVIFQYLLIILTIVLITNLVTSFKNPLKIAGGIIVTCLSIIGIIEIFSLIRWITNGLIYGSPFNDSSWDVPLIEMYLVNILNPILPRLILIFLASWIFRYLFTYYNNDLKYIGNYLTKLFKYNRNKQEEKTRFNLEINYKIIVIGIILIAIFVPIYPYLETVNPAQLTLGVDIPYYQKILNKTVEMDVNKSIFFIFQDNRSISHILHLLVTNFISHTIVLRYIPILLTMFFAGTTYILVKIGAGNKNLAILASFISICSYTTTVGINAAFFANWLALSLTNIAIFLFIISLRSRNNFHVLLSVITSILILFTHPWTWTVFMITSIFYLIITLTINNINIKDKLWEVKFFVLVIVSNLIIDTLKKNFIATSGFETTASSLSSGFKLMDISYVISSLDLTFSSFLGGSMANPVLIILSIIGFLSIGNYAIRFNRFLLSWGMIAILGVFLFGSPGSISEFFAARALFLVPFHIFGAIGIFELLKRLNVIVESINNLKIYNYYRILIWIIISMTFINYALRTLSILYPHVI